MHLVPFLMSYTFTLSTISLPVKDTCIHVLSDNNTGMQAEKDSLEKKTQKLSSEIEQLQARLDETRGNFYIGIVFN